MVRHRPFTKHSYPEGEMPDMQPESEAQEAKIAFAKDALAESFRVNSTLLNDMKVIEFRLSNVTTERDVALAEVERLGEKNELLIKTIESQKAKLEVVEAFDAHDLHLRTGG